MAHGKPNKTGVGRKSIVKRRRKRNLLREESKKLRVEARKEMEIELAKIESQRKEELQEQGNDIVDALIIDETPDEGI